jgi:hypothetical protein
VRKNPDKTPDELAADIEQITAGQNIFQGKYEKLA